MSELEKFSLPETIIGERVILTKRNHPHDEDLFNLIDGSREFLRRFLFWVDGTESVENVKFITNLFLNNFDEQKSFEYVVLDKETQKLVGAGGIHTICHKNRMAEYGYYLDKNATGHGYITEMVSLLEKELFENGIHRIVIKCDPDNIASAKVAERSGFILEGRLKEAVYAYGEYRDDLVYAKINPND